MAYRVTVPGTKQPAVGPPEMGSVSPIGRKLVISVNNGSPTTRSPGAWDYAHPWPDAIDGIGHRRVDAFSPCDGLCGIHGGAARSAATAVLVVAASASDARPGASGNGL